LPWWIGSYSDYDYWADLAASGKELVYGLLLGAWVLWSSRIIVVMAFASVPICFAPGPPAHRDVVQRVVNAISAALKREKSDRAFAEDEMSKFLGIKDKGELDFTYDFYVKQVLTPEPIPEARQLQSNIDALAPSNPKVKGLDPNSILDQSFAKAAEKAAAANAAPKSSEH